MDVPKRRLIWDLVQGGLSEESFIAQFGANPRTTPEIVRVELEESLTERSTDNLRVALILAFRFGLSRQWAQLLCKLMGEDWHHSHEDIAGALQDLRLPVTIDCLYRTALCKHDYLAYNDNESLAIKCIWALHDIGTLEAAEKLQRLSQSDLSARVREKALKRLSALAVTRPGDPVPAYRRARDQKVRPDWDLGGSQRDK